MSDTPYKTKVAVRNVAFHRVLRSELIKLFTLASTWWLLAIAVALTVGMGALMGWSINQLLTNPESVGMPPEMATEFDGLSATALAASGMQFMQLVMVILGVLYITNEYSTGSINSTLIAIPTRTVMVLAKAVNLSVTVFITALVSLYAATFVGWTFISQSGIDDRFTWEGLRLLAGAALANTLIAIFALAIGLLLRSTAAGIATALGVLLVLPGVISMLPWDWATTLGEYLPFAASTWLYTFNDATPLWHWTEWGFLKGLWVTGAWAVLPLTLGIITLKLRDAHTGD
ncbi:MAG: hypothetical protein LBC29_02205 [Propionibacteriaceae bacterium]|jgi:ABC-2 type transport system permease protein|nr:hypothetical protein [Propionibacteriaceae bacterium]